MPDTTRPVPACYKSVDTFKTVAYGRPPTDETSRHLEAVYGIEVTSLSELDRGVYRVDRAEGASWVARVFSRARPLALTEGDAEVLEFLAQYDYPAERPAHPQPVSVLEDHAVLVTTLIPGINVRSDNSPGTLGDLAQLLGRLHGLPSGTGAIARPAGSWHSLSIAGGTRREDISALMALLADVRVRSDNDRGRTFDDLCAELEALDLCEDLPSALSHPDFGPANAIRRPDGVLALVDWTGSGRIPRILALGPLLWTAGAWPDAIKAVADGYQKQQLLTEAELSRLVDALPLFLIVLDCWGIVYWGASAADVLARTKRARERAVVIAEATRAAFNPL